MIGFKKPKDDHYGFITEYHQRWTDRWLDALDRENEAEARACRAALDSLRDWTVYSAVGKDRYSEQIPHTIVKSAWSAYDFARMIWSIA